MSRRTVIATVCASCLALAGVGYAATFTLTTKKLGGGSVTTPIMFPDSVSTANVGPTVGKIEKNDTITFVWSRVIDETTLCSGWSNAQTTHTTNITWVVQNNTGSTGNDVLVPSTTATCTGGLHVGSVDLGSPNYVTANTNYTNAPTTITVLASTTQLVMKPANTPGGIGTVSSGSAGTWTPDSAVTDLNGRNCGANLSKTNETVLF
jgi:hypothetical protein